MKLWKPSYGKILWKGTLIFVVISFLVGQAAMYLLYGMQ